MGKASEKRALPQKGFWRFFDRLVDVMAALAGVILVFITAAVCYTIGMRFLFTKTTIWIMQTTEYALLWIVFLATTWLLREGGHITTDIIYTHLNEKTKRYSRWHHVCHRRADLRRPWSILGIRPCCASVLPGGVTDVRAVTVPKSAVFIIIPVGSLLLTLQFFRMAWSRLVEIRTGR